MGVYATERHNSNRPIEIHADGDLKLAIRDDQAVNLAVDIISAHRRLNKLPDWWNPYITECPEGHELFEDGDWSPCACLEAPVVA